MNLRDLYIPQIGDICTSINFTEHTERNGMACEVIGFVEVKSHDKGPCGYIWTPGTYFSIRFADGVETAVGLHNLIPKVNP